MWADDFAAVSCTGTGEMFLRAAVAAQIAHRLAYAHEDLASGADAALAEVRAMGGDGGLIAVNRAGEIVMPFISQGMKRAALLRDGTIVAEAF